MTIFSSYPKVDEKGSIIVGSADIILNENPADDKTINAGQLEVNDEVAQLKDEDILNGSGAANSALEAAVSEAVGGTELEVKGTEPQKDILHAILIGEDHPNHPNNNAGTVVTTSAVATSNSTVTQPLIKSKSNGNVQVVQEASAEFPPVSVQEFSSQQQNSN